jgi:hypothetical protein
MFVKSDEALFYSQSSVLAATPRKALCRLAFSVFSHLASNDVFLRRFAAILCNMQKSKNHA